MAECNTCGGYLSIEDKIRLSMKCDANGNVVWQGALLNQALTDEQVITLFGDRLSLWVKPEDETDGYFTNRIGSQDRVALGGSIHPGRAIQYDGSKSQYSRTSSNMPANFRLANNSLTIFCRVKMDSPPAGNSLLCGFASSSNGAYRGVISSNGKLTFYLTHSTTVSIATVSSICDAKWHDVFVLINKSGNFQLYVDNILIGTSDISTLTFNDYDVPFFVGGQTSFHSGVKKIRDLRIYSSAVLSESYRDIIHAGGYVSGISAWYFMEEGKESTWYDIKDSIGVNHLKNYNFDETSIVSGTWPSLLNKYGYSDENYESDDLILNDGEFDNPAEWTFTATRFEVAGGVAFYKAIDGIGLGMINKRALSIATTDIIKMSFDIIEGDTATFEVVNQAYSILLISATYAVGHHDIIFKPSNSNGATSIGIRAVPAGGAFKIDNLTFTKYDPAIIAPKMDAAIPTKDVWNRDLIFFGQAKYNLLKIDADTVQLPDYCGELFNAAELITVNDWYNADGEGNEIDTADIASYQTKRQYYNAGELIIMRSDAVLTDEEDEQLKKKLMLNSETYIPKALINTAKGTLTGANADIYKSKNWLTGDAYSELVLKEQVTMQTDPAHKYIAIGWADFFTPEDPQIVLALCAKYGMTHTFYRQIKPRSNDPRNTGGAYNRNELKMIEAQGSYDGNHGFLHISQIYNNPYADGRLTPSMTDMIMERADGTNEFGYDVDATVDDSIGAYLRSDWFNLSAEIGSTQWKNLTEYQCIAFTKALGVFGMPMDSQDELEVLQSLDYLSNRYCGTTGSSVADGNYKTRTPNTIDGLEPSSSNRILGGIFKGSATTCNHEIWERLLIIENEYKKEFEGKLSDHKFWATPGGISGEMLYKQVNYESGNGVYIDKEYSQLCTGVAKLQSSITGLTRSRIDCLRSAGYKASMAVAGGGYASPSTDNLTRLECQSIYQRNLSFKKEDTLGDGYHKALRHWVSTLTESDIDNAIASDDVVKYLYDICSTDERFTGISAYSPGNFAAFINEAMTFIAWGKIPDSVDDSLAAGSLLKRASMAFAHEALIRFSIRAGIKLISHEEAINIGLTAYNPENYFPNANLDTTVLTVLASENAPVYPDGWNGGSVIDDSGSVLSLTPGIYFIRQYAIKPGSFTLSFRSKGAATLIVKAIRNKHTYNRNDGNGFDVLETININDVDYSAHNQSVVVENAVIETYATPATPAEKAYQDYMRGYGDKICGLHFEIIVAEENELRIGDFELTI